MIDWARPLRMKGTGTQLIVEKATGTDYWVMGHEGGYRFRYTKTGKHIRNLNSAERLMPDLENITLQDQIEAWRKEKLAELAAHDAQEALERTPGYGSW